MLVNILYKQGVQAKIYTIYSVIAYISTKGKKIKLDKEKKACFGKKYLKKFQKKIGQFINFV